LIARRSDERSGVSEVMKKYLFALLHATRVLNFVSWVNRRKVTILSYHSIVDDHDPLRRDTHKQHLPIHLFSQHLDYLQKHYQVISLKEFVRARRERKPLPDYSIVLTFEDGFEDFYTVAARQLAQRQLPATAFVITDRAYGRLPPNGESFLSWDQIRELASAGVEIGSHTCSHPRLPDLSPEDVIRELADSRVAIKENLGTTDIPLSFPHGRTTDSISHLAQTLGYSCSITTRLGPNDGDADLSQLNRTTIASDDELPTFAARVSGFTWWMTKLRLSQNGEHDPESEPGYTPKYAPVAAETYDRAETLSQVSYNDRRAPARFRI
jgi:peptidoglycan/xylan/chitin deacetylase (PgdA/CDA1 family)